MFSHIFSRNTDVQERNEGTLVELQVQGIQESTSIRRFNKNIRHFNKRKANTFEKLYHKDKTL